MAVKSEIAGKTRHIVSSKKSPFQNSKAVHPQATTHRPSTLQAIVPSRYFDPQPVSLHRTPKQYRASTHALFGLCPNLTTWQIAPMVVSLAALLGRSLPGPRRRSTHGIDTKLCRPSMIQVLGSTATYSAAVHWSVSKCVAVLSSRPSWRRSPTSPSPSMLATNCLNDGHARNNSRAKADKKIDEVGKSRPKWLKYIAVFAFPFKHKFFTISAAVAAFPLDTTFGLCTTIRRPALP